MLCVALQRLRLIISGLSRWSAELSGLMVGQTFRDVTRWSSIMAVLRRVKAAVGDGLAKLLVGMHIVRMEATELAPAEATCLRRMFTLLVRAGRQFIVEGTWFSSVDILALVRAQ